jgi:hypothetical protein
MFSHPLESFPSTMSPEDQTYITHFDVENPKPIRDSKEAEYQKIPVIDTMVCQPLQASFPMTQSDSTIIDLYTPK